jgi:hypothetical protein
VSANFNDCEDMEGLTFTIYLNSKKVSSITGEVADKKWMPTSCNEISIVNYEINLKEASKEGQIKISTEIGEELSACTIPLNKLTFKYLVPVLQTSNLRSREDREPTGHIHFKIEYVDVVKEYRERVLSNLQARKQGLEELKRSIEKKMMGGMGKPL